MKKYIPHVVKYLYEALGLGIFMFSAGFFDMLIDHPALYTRQHLSSSLLRRSLIGATMGLTALAIFTSAWGKKSGAYINPAVTLIRYRRREITGIDALFYILFQFLGGWVGMYFVYRLFPSLISHPSINYIVTVPGKQGIVVAFIAEFIISAILMAVVLITEKHTVFKKYTVYLVALLILLFITFEAPLSGMSMNPARTFASAAVAGNWTGWWIYYLAPIGGMLAGEQIARLATHHKHKVI